MKKLSTKTIATLTVVTAAAAAMPGASRLTPGVHGSQYDKLLQRHDRKGDLRASILGMPAHELKRQLRTRSFGSLLASRGMSERTFRLALLGALKNELKSRGWTAAKVDDYICLRLPRTLAVAVAA
jgi:hypothetical protein